MAITNKFIVSKILGQIKEIEGEDINYKDILLNTDFLCNNLLEVFDNGKRRMPIQDYGEYEGITYHSPSKKIYKNYLAAIEDCKNWLNQTADEQLFASYLLIMSMTKQELVTYLQRFNDEGEIFYESCPNKNN